jgi:hypothetical protein
LFYSLLDKRFYGYIDAGRASIKVSFPASENSDASSVVSNQSVYLAPQTKDLQKLLNPKHIPQERPMTKPVELLNSFKIPLVVPLKFPASGFQIGPRLSLQGHLFQVYLNHEFELMIKLIDEIYEMLGVYLRFSIISNKIIKKKYHKSLIFARTMKEHLIFDLSEKLKTSFDTIEIEVIISVEPIKPSMIFKAKNAIKLPPLPKIKPKHGSVHEPSHLKIMPASSCAKKRAPKLQLN